MSNAEKEFKRMKAEATAIMLEKESIADPAASAAPSGELPPLPDYYPTAQIHATEENRAKLYAKDYARAAIAASAPNKQLVAALKQVMRPYGIYDVAVSKSGALQDDFMEVGKQIRAALAAAGEDSK